MALASMFKETVSHLWWLVLLRGSAMLLLGLLLVAEPGETVVSLTLVLGAYWLVNGILAIVGIFVGESSIPWGWLLLYGILGILAGLFVLKHPLMNALFLGTTLVYILAFQALAMGVINIIQGFKGGGVWAVIMGILNILVGAVLLFNPQEAVAALPIVLGILAIAGGVILIVLSLRLRSVTKKGLAPAS